MILVDTSVWIELFRKPSNYHIDQDELMRVVICAPILQELLQGLTEASSASTIKEQLLSIPLVEEPVILDRYIEAAEIYRLGRRKGKTIRSSYDCLIASIALKGDVPVWHKDRDFEEIRSFTALKTITARKLPVKNVR